MITDTTETIPCPDCKNETWLLCQDIRTIPKEGYLPRKEISAWYLMCSKCLKRKEVE